MGRLGLVAVLLGGVLLVVGLRGSETLAQTFFRHVSWLTAVAPEADPDTTTARSRVRALRDLSMHPAEMHAPYFSPTFAAMATRDSSLLRSFHDLLDLYVKRQGVDDNFTVRVLDARTYETLEVYTLTDLREQYRSGVPMHWPAVDRERRRATRRLVDKYVAQGIPRGKIAVRWGRATQLAAAHERKKPILEYEVNLARYLGLSLLPTEIPTVETFNQDDMVSPVGARSRYQMMPWIMRRSGVQTYTLQTASGNWLEVREERHPLLTLEAAFSLLRGYVNAVGHEIPGISAYHTGPGNIYTVYRLFLTKSEHFHPEATVTDAFLWALTDGYSTVREVSTFGPYSRGYVPSTYGALMGNADRVIDPSRTLRAVRVQVRPGERVLLADLLDAVTASGPVDWGPSVSGGTPYARFRTLNPHLNLPPATEGEAVPPEGNVRLVASVDGSAVRFFLPLEAPERLNAARLDVLDEAASFRFDETTYTNPNRTKWDRRYSALVDDIAAFGFTEDHRTRLLRLNEAFARLAEATPTHYRRMQLDIIQTHRRIWLSAPWDKLAETTARAMGERMPVQPPETLPTRPLDSVLGTPSAPR